MNTPKIKPNQACPCGSGKKYKKCCAGKKLTWAQHEDGTFSRGIPVEGELESTLKDLKAQFILHFEREPGAGDPIFLGKYLLSVADLQRSIVGVLEQAEVDPAHIYAYQKTGYLISEPYIDRATGASVQEWDSAIDEFDAHNGPPPTSKEAIQFDSLIDKLNSDIESLIYMIGLASDKYFNIDYLSLPKTPSMLLAPEQYQALCAVRTHRSLRSIRLLLQERMADDAVKLVRSIYENYLHMCYIMHNPDKLYDLVDAVVGLRIGTHMYKKKRDGTDDKRTIIHLESGKEFFGHISSHKMAASSNIPEDLCFFDFFYKRTSEFLHPSIFVLDGYISESGLDAVKPHMYEEAIIFTACIACMIVDQIRFMTNCPEGIQQDCLTIVKRVKSHLINLFTLLDQWQERLGTNIQDVEMLKSRCEALARD